jgi:hypothetical protein
MNLQTFYTFKKRFLYIVCLSLLSVILLIILSPGSQKENVGNITNPIAIIIAASLSILISYRQKVDGEIGKAFLILTIGLIIWAVAEILFSASGFITLELERNIMLSDALWLIGYGPIIYYSLKMYVLFHNYSSKKSISVILILMTAYLVYIIPFISDTYIRSSHEDLPLLYISISYLLLDLVFIFPASLVIWNSGIFGKNQGDLTFFPWMFVAMIIIGMADSIFAYTSVSGYYQLEWMTTPVYTSGYLFMAFGLYWHHKFFIYNEKVPK